MWVLMREPMTRTVYTDENLQPTHWQNTVREASPVQKKTETKSRATKWIHEKNLNDDLQHVSDWNFQTNVANQLVSFAQLKEW
jgi:hypothetical protein